MPKFTRTNVEEGDGAVAAINANLADLETFSDDILTRTALSPNSMQTDLDLNGMDLLNVGEITFGTGILNDAIFGGIVRINSSGITTTSGNLELSSDTGLVCINGEYCLPPTDGTAGQVIATDGAGQCSFVSLPGAGTPTLSMIQSQEVALATGASSSISANTTAALGTFTILTQESADMHYLTCTGRIQTGDNDSIIDLRVVRDLGGLDEEIVAFSRCATRGDGTIHTMLHATGLDVGMPGGQLVEYTVQLITPDNGQANITYSDFYLNSYHLRLGAA